MGLYDLLDVLISAAKAHKDEYQKVSVSQPSLPETTLLCVSIRIWICRHKDPAVSQPHMLNAHKWKDTQGPVTSQMAFVPVTRLDEFVLCVCVNTLHSECIVCDISITVCIVRGGGERWRFSCVAVCWLNPFGGDAAKTNWTLFFFFLLINLAIVIITNFLISLWKKQLISMEMGIGESSRADDSLWIYSFAEPQLRWSRAEWLDGDKGKKTETNCDLWRLHISFTGYSVLGEIGTLCGAPPQHFSLTGGEAIGGVSNLAVAARPSRRAVTLASR